MSRLIPFSPEAIKAINEFCDLEELAIRAQLMDDLEGYFLEADEVDDHKARDYARALRLLKNDLETLIETTQMTENNERDE